jgi:hypothetical protein
LRPAIAFCAITFALVSCSSEPEISASAECYPVVDTGGGITSTTESADVTITSSVDLTSADVHVDLLDSSGAALGYFTGEIGAIKADEPKTVKMNVGPTNASVAGGVPPGGWESVTECSATVTDYTEA